METQGRTATCRLRSETSGDTSPWGSSLRSWEVTSCHWGPPGSGVTVFRQLERNDPKSVRVVCADCCWLLSVLSDLRGWVRVTFHLTLSLAEKRFGRFQFRGP